MIITDTSFYAIFLSYFYIFSAIVNGQFFIQNTSYFNNIIGFVKKLTSGELDKIIVFLDTSPTADPYEVHKDKQHIYNNIMNSKESYNNTTIHNNTTNKEIGKEGNIENKKFSRENTDSDITTSNKSSNQLDEKSNKTCTENNERYPFPGSCDRYFECQVSSRTAVK